MTSLSRLARLPPEFSLAWNRMDTAPLRPLSDPEYTIWLWSFVGTFCGLSILQTVFGYSQYFVERNVPSIIASYGASAVLCFGVIEAPLVQPRALMGGHFIKRPHRCFITKLFSLLPTEARIDELRWLAGSPPPLSVLLMKWDGFHLSGFGFIPSGLSPSANLSPQPSQSTAMTHSLKISEFDTFDIHSQQ